jgi:transcriptional regulator with XRE-family HTH domain
MDDSVSGEMAVGAESARLLKRGVPGLGARIARLRDAQGLSRAALARGLGVSRDRLSKWELGKNDPPLDVLIGLRHLLGVTLDELMVGASGAPASQEVLSVEAFRAVARIMAELESLLKRAGIVDDGDQGEKP